MRPENRMRLESLTISTAIGLKCILFKAILKKFVEDPIYPIQMNSENL